jgi:hypothetical protein
VIFGLPKDAPTPINTEVGRFAYLSLRSPSLPTCDPGILRDSFDIAEISAEQIGDPGVRKLGLENELRDFLIHSLSQQPQALVVVERLHELGFEKLEIFFQLAICGLSESTGVGPL